MRASRQTFEAAIPHSCLLVADHLSARSLAVTWIHWNVINFACKKGSVGNTHHLPRTKMLFFPMSVFCSGGFSFN